MILQASPAESIGFGSHLVCWFGCGVWGQGFGFRVDGFGFRVDGFGFRVEGLGFGVQGF